MNWYADFAEIVKSDVPLAPLTWFGLGGPAKYFVEPASVEQLHAVVVRLRENDIPMYILGAGADLLVRDAGVNGAVLRLRGPVFESVQIDGTLVTAGAGKDVQRLVLETTRLGLAGMECLAGIPGTLGGEIRMNAGGAFGDISSVVQSVTVMDTHGQLFTRQREDLVFEYRRCNITAKFILGATLQLAEDDPQRVADKVKEIWMYKKNSQPLSEHSAGCIFKNPRGQSAGKLIDQAGLKGTTVGGAEVSERHANFIVAHPGATTADVLALIDKIKATVADKFAVQLETEVVVW